MHNKVQSVEVEAEFRDQESGIRDQEQASNAYLLPDS